jgi:hypothetical protein
LTIRKLKWGPLELDRAVDAGAEAIIHREHRHASKAELRRDLQRLPRARVLWVDDHPDWNRS